MAGEYPANRATGNGGCGGATGGAAGGATGGGMIPAGILPEIEAPGVMGGTCPVPLGASVGHIQTPFLALEPVFPWFPFCEPLP